MEQCYGCKSLAERIEQTERALDAEREKVKELVANQAEYEKCTDEQITALNQGCLDYEKQIATLQAQLADEQQRADRAAKDRSEVLDVKTKEGLSCSEWLMRTATAERKVKGLQAQLADRDAMILQMGEQAAVLAKENMAVKAQLRQVEGERHIDACCGTPNDCKWGGIGGCGYEGRKYELKQDAGTAVSSG